MQFDPKSQGLTITVKEAKTSADRESAVTAVGYYWHRGSKSDEVQVVHVRLDYSEKEVPFVVQSGSPANVGEKSYVQLD